jgi:hypothetical protein
MHNRFFKPKINYIVAFLAAVYIAYLGGLRSRGKKVFSVCAGAVNQK